MWLGRRVVLQALGWGLLGCARTARPRDQSTSDFTRRLVTLEQRSEGRLGVAAWAPESDWRLGYREHERFPMCSTFKVPLVAAVLQRVDTQRDSLARFVPYDSSALLEYAPVTREHLSQGGMTLEELCAASVISSDNTAANLLLQTLGGPAGVTAFFRSVGDDVSRLDRTEPWLNTALAGDDRDTTTPSAMCGTLSQVLLGASTLSDLSRQRLLGWLEQCSTGRGRLRAGLPAAWRAGDKTGTGENGTTNDVAITWQQSGAPLLIAAYSTGSRQSVEQRSATLAEVARSVVANLPGGYRPI
jgi:beta-lactamase class A